MLADLYVLLGVLASGVVALLVWTNQVRKWTRQETDLETTQDDIETIRRVQDETTGDRGGVDGALERMRRRQGRDE